MLKPSSTVDHQADDEELDNISYNYEGDFHKVIDLSGNNIEMNDDVLEYINHLLLEAEGELEYEFSKMVIETAPEVGFKELKL